MNPYYQETINLKVNYEYAPKIEMKNIFKYVFTYVIHIRD